MSRQQLPSQIRKVTLTSRKDGRPVVRYEVRVDVGTTGHRKQTKRRFRTEQEARNALGRTIDQRATGTYVLKSGDTMREVIEAWLAGKTGVRRTTWTQYRDYLKPVIELYGDMPVQDLKKSHIDTLLGLLEAGDLSRTDAKLRRKPWSGQSRRHLLANLSRVLDSEVKQGRLARNVAVLVDTPPLDKKQRPTYDVKQLRTLLDGTRDDREGIAWQLGSIGLRRAEIAGLRWQDVDMDAHTLTICHTRVMVDGHAQISTPKTQAGIRTLPIPDPVYTALLHAKALQKREGIVAEYVVVNEAGQPYRPEYLTKLFKKACKRLGLPPINLHDERHSFATNGIANGENPVKMSWYLGHTSIRTPLDLYVHKRSDELLSVAQGYAELLRDVSTDSVKEAG